MKYYMGYTKRDSYRHLANQVEVEANIPEVPVNTDPISSIFYKECDPKIHARAICGALLVNFLRHITKKGLITYGHHWDDDFSCINCRRLRK